MLSMGMCKDILFDKVPSMVGAGLDLSWIIPNYVAIDLGCLGISHDVLSLSIIYETYLNNAAPTFNR